ncbi:MAG: hypothetical protein ACE5GK_11840 [Nitrospiria bacterium]
MIEVCNQTNAQQTVLGTQHPYLKGAGKAGDVPTSAFKRLEPKG